MIATGLTRYRRPLFQAALAGVDALGACLALILAALARERLDLLPGWAPAEAVPPSSFKFSLLAVIVVVVYARMELYHIRRGWKALHLATTAAIGAAVATGLFLAGCYLARDHSVSRVAILIVWALLALASFAVRWVARETVIWCGRHGVGVKRVVLIGDNATAASIIRRIADNPHAGLALVGRAQPRDPGPGSAACIRQGNVDDIAQELIGCKPHRVLFAVDIAEHDELQALADLCLSHGIEVLQVPRLHHAYPGRVASMELLGMPFLGFGNHGLDGWELVVKDVVDRVAALVALVVLSPVLAILAAGTWWGARGVILRRARRAGKEGVPFTLLRFETCRAEAGQRIHSSLGAFLSRHRLDGLPQLVNVLLGEMSLVGPSPDTPEGMHRLNDWQRRRLTVKPGLTGLAQVKGRRTERDPAAMIKDDLEYIDRQSLVLDGEILITAARGVVARFTRGWEDGSGSRPARSGGRPARARVIPGSAEGPGRVTP